MNDTETPEAVSNDSERPLLTSRELANNQGVSVRTARRMKHRDTIPQPMKCLDGTVLPARKVGKDGKSYPLHRCHRCNLKNTDAPYASSIRDAMRLTRCGLRKADRLACQHGIDAQLAASVSALAAMAKDMATRWASVLPQETEVTHG